MRCLLYPVGAERSHMMGAGFFLGVLIAVASIGLMAGGIWLIIRGCDGPRRVAGVLYTFAGVVLSITSAGVLHGTVA